MAEATQKTSSTMQYTQPINSQKFAYSTENAVNRVLIVTKTNE